MKVAIVTDSQFLCEKTMYLGELKDEMKTQGIIVDLFPILNASWSILEGKFAAQRLLKTSLMIPTIRKYDLVHVQFTFPIGFLLSLLKGLHGKPVVIHTHGDDVFVVPSADIGFRRSAFGSLVTNISWKSASQIIAVCKEAKTEIVNAGVPQGKVNVLYNGVNENFFRRANNLEENPYANIHEGIDLVFLNAGGLKEVKNQIRLLQAFRGYCAESIGNSKLIICGSGHLARTLHATAVKLNLNDKVVFLGQVSHDRMPQLYSAVDAYILPSLHEAHPWSILEAMSCELPVAASKVGGIPETINNGKLLIDPWKVDEICNAMRFLAENPERRTYIGQQNRKTVLEKFTLKQHATKLESIYSKALKDIR